MVKELPEDHPMRMFGASHWCKYDYPKDMSFVEFLEILELISSVDGAERDWTGIGAGLLRIASTGTKLTYS